MDERKPTPGPEPAPPPERRDRAPLPVPPEVGGRGGAEPTRYGDWEVNGICTDF